MIADKIKELDEKINKLQEELNVLKKIQKIEENIFELKKLQAMTPIIISQPLYNQNPNLHYHGAMPCYNNPCIWC